MSDSDSGNPQAKVYLCGPMTGREIDREWRTYAAAFLHRHGIGVLDPTAGVDNESIGNGGLEYEGKLAPIDHALRDRGMVENCDILLGHFPYLPTDRPSIGSLWECGWADAMGKAVIISSHLACVRDHLFCRAFAYHITEHIDEAMNRIVDLVKWNKQYDSKMG